MRWVKLFVRGAIIFAVVVSTMVCALLFFIVFGSSVTVTYGNNSIRPNEHGILLILIILIASTAATMYLVAPIFLSDTLFKSQKEIDDLKRQLDEEKQNLIRKISKL